RKPCCDYYLTQRW
ncbi:hypothetical protein D046_4462B, partial [Vibrio parahaemolyticus V-223/04]